MRKREPKHRGKTRQSKTRPRQNENRPRHFNRTPRQNGNRARQIEGAARQIGGRARRFFRAGEGRVWGLGGLGVAWQRGLSTAGLKQLNERGGSGAAGSSTPPYRIARRGGSRRRHDARARRVRWARHFASLKLGGSELRRVAPLARRLRPAAVGAAGKRPSLKRGGCELRRTQPWAGNLDSRHFAPDPAPSLPEDKSSQQQCSEVRS